ncbi:MAG: PAS-domain containing protein, partial [Elioraea sp.]|nr:PAS-domain containing protein [Elioraea sp.]
MNGRGGRFGVAAVGLLLVVLAFVAMVVQLARDQIAAEEAAAEKGQLAAVVLEDHLRRHLVPLDEAAARLARQSGGRADAIGTAALLAVAEGATPALRALAVVDGDGRILASTLGPVGGRVAVDLAEISRSVLAFDPGRAVVGRPVPDPLTGEVSLPLARRITRPGGAFGGLVVAYLDPDALFRRLPAAVAAEGTTAVLIRSDGWLLAASGPGLGPVGSPLVQEGLYDTLRARAEGVIALGEGAAHGRTLVAFRHLAELPLIAAVAIAQRTLLLGLSPAAATGGAIAALVALGLLILLAGLRAEARRMRAREAALAAEGRALAEKSEALAREKRLADDKTELLETTLAALADGVIVVDGNLRLVTWNNRVPDLLGLPPQLLRAGTRYEEMLRALARAGEFGPADTETEVRRRLDQARAGTHTTEERKRPNGRVIETRTAPLPAGGFVAILRDVTDRHEAEEQLRRGRAMAEAASAAKSNFVAIVSHEIRTPMNAVIGTLGLLADTQLDAEQKRYVETARDSAEHLLDIINDILDLSKIEAGRIALEPTDFALAPLVSAVVDLFRPACLAAGIALEVEIGPGVPPHVRSDPGRIRQILLNLLSNAVKHTQSGDIRVEIGLAAPPRRGEPWQVRFAVADRGPGVPPERKAELFEPFAEMEPAGQRRPGGTGLGLAICRRLVELLGGSIGIVDRAGGGAIFWFVLPLAEAASAPDQPAEPSPLPRARRARVLIAEDSPANQLVAATWLRKDGHHVDVVGNGREAVDAVASRPYDIVFMDLMMPEMDGLAATREIRRLPPPAGTVPIIALTANVMAGDRERFVAAGMNGVLAKPVTGRMLSEALFDQVGPAEESAPASAPAGSTEPPPEEVPDIIDRA